MSLRSEVVRIFNELMSSNSKKITELPTAGAISGTELIEIVQSGANVKTTISAVASGGSGVLSVVAGTNVTVNNADPANPIVSASGGGSSAFVSLTDGPGSYAGKTLNFTRVNAGETALEYRTPAQVKTDLGVLTSLPSNWSFPAGAFPTTAGIIYIATADHGVIGDADYVAIGTWMIANTLTPSTYSHFIYK